MAKKKMKPFVSDDGIRYVPYDIEEEVYIKEDDLEEMLTHNDPNALSRIIMNWKMAHPTGTKEEFMQDSYFKQSTIDKLWQ